MLSLCLPLLAGEVLLVMVICQPKESKVWLFGTVRNIYMYRFIMVLDYFR